MTENKTEITTYKEKQIGNTIYRVTSVFTGEKDLGKTLEKLAIDKVISEIRGAATTSVRA